MRLLSLTVTIYICTGSLVYSAIETHDNSTSTQAIESKRVEVYSLSQNYWDTQSGDTLGNIVLHLLPNNPSKYARLKQDIVLLNPHAFIGGNPERLLADKRLWLPVYMKQADTKSNPATTTVEQFSWGNIKRPRE
jgi:Tfp pilus assembly protein FimV